MLRRRRRSMAPRSSTIDSPRSVGQSAAIAGPLDPAPWSRRLNFAIAISAPVLPAETATSASPFFTASMASHIEDFQRPWRSAWLGLSSILTATSVWTSCEAALSRGRASSSGSITARSPNSRNSMPGWRLSDSSAPGTTTDAPWSPPMASSAIRTLWGMNREYRVGQGRNRGQLSRAAALPFLERRQRRKRMCRIVAGRSGLEDRARLARIGIDRRESGTRSRARRDRPRRRSAVPARRRASIATSRAAVVGRRCRRGWREHEVDRFVDLVLDRLERHHAGLADGRRDAADHAQAVAAVPRDVELGLKARQRAQPGEPRDGRARALVGDELDVPSGLRTPRAARPARSRDVRR